MNNMFSLYRFEVRKILCRRMTAVVLLAVSLLMFAMNVGEYAAGSKLVNREEAVLAGRPVNDEMLEEMRAAAEPKTFTAEDGTPMIVGMAVNDPAYRPLLDYLYVIGGNFDKAYSMTEAGLKERFDGVVSEALQTQYLTDAEKDYWAERYAASPMPLTYGKIQNGWGDATCIIYVVAILSMICIAATLSGVFSEEMHLRTDALLFSSRNGKKRLLTVKLLAGMTVGVLETAVVLLVCVVTEFAVSGFGGGETSVRFFVGPTAMDMSIRRAFFIYVGIMLVIGLLMSVFAMCLSQVLRNSVAVVAVMMGFWLISMVNFPYSWRFVSQICSYLPVTFLGSWTFSDYRTVGFAGRLFTILQVAPVLYLLTAVGLGIVTKISYDRYQRN